MPLRRKRDRVYVLTPARDGGQNINYGFNTSMLTADGTQLGHLEISEAGGATVWFGVNSPKPARFAKTTATGTVSSFCSVTATVSAADQGWSEVSAATFSAPGSTDKTQLVGVDMGNGFFYCWNMDRGDFAEYGNLMGISVATGTTEIVIGAQRPKPLRVYRTVAGAGDDGTRVQTSFIAPGTDIPDGWKPISRSKKAGWS